MQARGILTDDLKQRVYVWYQEGHKVADIAACMGCSTSVIYRALRERPPIQRKPLTLKDNGQVSKLGLDDTYKQIKRLEEDNKKLQRLHQVLQEALYKGVDTDRELMRISVDIEATQRELQALYKAYNEQVS